MQQPSLSLKATVSRRAPIPAAQLVDANERAAQLQHYRDAENAAQAANEARTAVQTDQAVCNPRGEFQTAFLAGNLGKAVTVFLVNGIKLVGRLRQFDQFTVLLENNGEQLLVFKHAISTIIPTAR